MAAAGGKRAMVQGAATRATVQRTAGHVARGGSRTMFLRRAAYSAVYSSYRNPMLAIGLFSTVAVYLHYKGKLR